MRGLLASIGLIVLLAGCETTQEAIRFPPVEPIVGTVTVGDDPFEGMVLRSRNSTNLTKGSTSGEIEQAAVWEVDKFSTEEEIALTARLRDLSFASSGDVKQDGLTADQIDDLVGNLAVFIAINTRTGKTSINLASADDVQSELGKMAHAFETFGESMAAAYLGGRDLVQGQELHVLGTPDLPGDPRNGVSVDVIEQVSGQTTYRGRQVIVIDGGGTINAPGGDVFFVKGRSFVDLATGIHVWMDMTIEAFIRANGVTVRQHQVMEADFGKNAVGI